MEIKTEADDVDEGVSPNELKPSGGPFVTTGSGRWSSPKIRKKLKHAMSFTKTQSKMLNVVSLTRSAHQEWDYSDSSLELNYSTTEMCFDTDERPYSREAGIVAVIPPQKRIYLSTYCLL